MPTNGSGNPKPRRNLICGLGIMGYDIFRDSQYAPLPVEFDPVGGIGRKLDCTRFCPEAGHYISNWTSSLKLRYQ
jgi:hypothetical protein